jgi:hypothetical protein
MKTSVYQSDGVRVIVMVFNATFNNISVIVVVSFIVGGGNQRTRRKSPTCRKSLTNFKISHNVAIDDVHRTTFFVM